VASLQRSAGALPGLDGQRRAAETPRGGTNMVPELNTVARVYRRPGRLPPAAAALKTSI
jgi:hypothetical protein